MTVTLHPLERQWDENTVTYNQAESGKPWASPGGDFEAEPAASITLNGTTPGYVSVSILDSVRAWETNPDANHGLLLNVAQAGYNSARSLRASDYWDQNLRPKLKIIYEPIPPTPTPTTGSVSGVVYEDANRNHRYDEGEPLLAGALLELQQNGVTLAQQTTGVDGAYHFTQLASGSYLLIESPPSGYGPARPTGNVIFTIANGDDKTFNFGHDPRIYLPVIFQ
jgi:hypothetical protein